MRDRTCYDIDDNNNNKINISYATQKLNWCLLIRTTLIYLYEWLNSFIFFIIFYLFIESDKTEIGRLKCDVAMGKENHKAQQ